MDTYNTLLSSNPSWTKARLYGDFNYIILSFNPSRSSDKRQSSCSLIRYCLVSNTEQQSDFTWKFPYEVDRMDNYNTLLSFDPSWTKARLYGDLLIPCCILPPAEQKPDLTGIYRSIDERLSSCSLIRCWYIEVLQLENLLWIWDLYTEEGITR